MTHHIPNQPEKFRHCARGCWLNLGLACVALCGAGCSAAKSDPPPFESNSPAYQPVAAYVAALNAHAFDNAADFATEDWNEIGPTGVWSRGRDAVVASLSKLEAAILKDVTFHVESAAIEYASPDVALVTMTTVAVNYHPTEEARERGSFVVVNQNNQWRLLNTQVSTVTGEDTSPASAGHEGPVPTDIGGDAVSEQVRSAKAHEAVAWFQSLPVSHDFSSAPEFSTADWNFVAPIGYWTQNRDDTVAGIESAFTTFLDGATMTEDQVVVRFPTANVVLMTVAGTTVVADEASHTVGTFVSVNHQNRWLLADTHITGVR